MKCPNCGSSALIIDYDTGEEVCGICGLVVQSEMLNTGPEWRAFTTTENNSRARTGLALSYTLYDKGLSTIFRPDRDANGNLLDHDTRIKMARLRRFDNRSKIDETWQRNLSIAMAELDRMATALHLPKNVKERSALIYRKALKKDLLRGRSIDGFVGASVYAACRQLKLPRPLKELTKVSTRNHSEVARTYRLLLKELQLKMPVDDPFKFIPGIASKLKLNQSTERSAIDILRKAAKRRGLTGKDPRGLAAAALYEASIMNDDKRIQKEIAMAAGTTEVTLRNRLKGIETLLHD
ncbi:MAG: transcription initiation factor IIB [Candidatus Bathyarchaeota archaeon]|nr:transcription initiation factor IIB [Candidatus Bathyarchaeota archaeon]